MVVGFRQNSSQYPYFVLKRLGTTQSLGNVSSTYYFLTFTTISYDPASMVTGAGGIITIPVNGIYQFNVALTIINNGASSDDSMLFGFRITDGANVSNYSIGDDWGLWTNSTDEISASFVVSLNCTENSTIQLYGYNLTDYVNFTNGCFSGYLVAAFT